LELESVAALELELELELESAVELVAEMEEQRRYHLARVLENRTPQRGCPPPLGSHRLSPRDWVRG
jgi:hypothetical protein